MLHFTGCNGDLAHDLADEAANPPNMKLQLYYYFCQHTATHVLPDLNLLNLPLKHVIEEGSVLSCYQCKTALLF